MTHTGHAMDSATLDEGAALLAAATPGPWKHVRGGGSLSNSHTIRDDLNLPIAETWHTAQNKSAENAAAVAWLRTHAADLIAAARQAQDSAKDAERYKANGEFIISQLCDRCLVKLDNLGAAAADAGVDAAITAATPGKAGT